MELRLFGSMFRKFRELSGKHMENDDDNGRMCPQRMEEYINYANITHKQRPVINGGILILILIY